MDVLTQPQRRLNMRRIRSKDTKPEMFIRRGLHERGMRFRLHAAELPGRPDIVFPRYRAVILVHGCFWHGHGCHLSKLPKTRRLFWSMKIRNSSLRDSRTLIAIKSKGWRALIVWECALRGRNRMNVQRLLDCIEAFLKNENRLTMQIKGGRKPFHSKRKATR
jgi:DNA mismatch endonuclease, patch repair protein